MSRYAAFVIQFIIWFECCYENIESFIFAEELEHVSAFFDTRQPFEDTMVKLIGKSRIWGKGTNMGNTYALREQYPLLFDPKYSCNIVSDTKTLEI